MNLKYEFSRKTKNIFRIIFVIILLALLIYIVGLFTQVVGVAVARKLPSVDFNPIKCFSYAFNFQLSKMVWLVSLIVGALITAFIFINGDKRGKMDNTRKDEKYNFEYSHKETYGSAEMMTEREINKLFKVVPASIAGVEKTNGDILFGFLNEKKKKIVSMPERDWKKGTDYNRNIAVCGPPGTGKSRAFVMNYIISKIIMGESLYVVDTKGEIYAKTYNFAKSRGYEIKILNLVETDCSDGWDILGEVQNNPDMAMELAATVIRNTGGPKADQFWNDAEMNIFKAVILLKSIGRADISNPSGKKQNLGDVYEYVATRKLTFKLGGTESMEADFGFLQENFPTHPAITPFLQFLNAGPDLGRQILHGLGNRLQLFQNAQLAKVLGTKDIDLVKSGTQRSIYYLRFSDQTSTYSFITSLFFSFMFVKLIGYADTHGGTLPVPVNVVADEFINIGTIPDFEKKISTARSRMVNIVIIYQSNMLFESAYPNNLWEAILADCDVFLVLGVGNELTTAEFVSKMTGEATTSVSSNSVNIGTTDMRSTSSTGKRYVKTPDEIRRMDPRNELVFVRGRNVMELRKMDYTENPIYLKYKEIFDCETSVTDHVSKVEKVLVDYENFVFDSVSRQSYLSGKSSNTANTNNPDFNNFNHNDNTQKNTDRKPQPKQPKSNSFLTNKHSAHRQNGNLPKGL